MKDFDSDQSFRTFSETITNKSYLELLEKYVLLEKTNDLDKKHKEWSNKYLNNWLFNIYVDNSVRKICWVKI